MKVCHYRFRFKCCLFSIIEDDTSFIIKRDTKLQAHQWGMLLSVHWSQFIIILFLENGSSHLSFNSTVDHFCYHFVPFVLRFWHHCSNLASVKNTVKGRKGFKCKWKKGLGVLCVCPTSLFIFTYVGYIKHETLVTIDSV